MQSDAGSVTEIPAPGVAKELKARWRPLVAAILGMFIGTLPTYSIGAFIGPLSEEFGWSVTRITGWSIAWSIGCIAAALLVGMLADRIGARRVALASIIAMAVALAGISLGTTNIVLFYLGGAAIGAITAGTSGITYGRVVSSHFDRGLGTALGLMSSGIGISAVLGPRMAQAAIDAWGWRWGFAGMALLALLVLPVVALWLKEGTVASRAGGDGSDRASGITLHGALRMPVFWFMAVGAVLYGICVNGVATNLIPYLTASGMSRVDAAAAMGLFGAATILGRFGTGMVIDKIRMHAALLMALVLLAEATAFILIGTAGTIFLVFALIVFGLSVGAEADCLAYCTIRIFGRRFFSSIFGILGTVMLYLGTGVGPFLFNIVRDRFGSYDASFFVWAGFALLAAPLFAWVTRTPFHDARPAQRDVQATPKVNPPVAIAVQGS